MAEKGKMTRQESALVSILERMADQLTKQDQLLEDVNTRQFDLTKALEAIEFQIEARQNDYSRALESMEYQIGIRQSGADSDVKGLQDTISRYRSDMLSLVNEQDNINIKVAELNTLLNKTVYAMEKANQTISELEAKSKSQEKIANEHFTHSLKQAEILPKEISNSTQSISKLHMDTEKSLGKMHQDTQRQLEKLQQDTTRRLLVLGDIETALQTILVRTEPPEKKPFWIKRLFRRVFGFFRLKINQLIRRIKPISKD